MSVNPVSGAAAEAGNIPSLEGNCTDVRERYDSFDVRA